MEAISEGICVEGRLPGSAPVRQALIHQTARIGWAGGARPGFECRPCHVEAVLSLISHLTFQSLRCFL